MGNADLKQEGNNANTLLANRCFWDDLDRRIRRTQKFLHWMIDGQFQHGISPMRFPNLTPERVEEIYNVDFGD
jgi:hypothetical protein